MKRLIAYCFSLIVIGTSCENDQLPDLTPAANDEFQAGDVLIPRLVEVFQEEDLKATIIPTYNSSGQIATVQFDFSASCDGCVGETYRFSYTNEGLIASVCNEAGCETYSRDRDGKLLSIDNYTFSEVQLRFLYNEGELPFRTEEYEVDSTGNFELRRFTNFEFSANGNLLRQDLFSASGDMFGRTEFSYDDQLGIFSQLVPHAYFFTPHFSVNNFREITRMNSDGEGYKVEHQYVYNELGYPLEIKEWVTNLTRGETLEDETLRISYQLKDAAQD